MKRFALPRRPSVFSVFSVLCLLGSGACTQQPRQANPDQSTLTSRTGGVPEPPHLLLQPLGTSPCNDGIDNDGDGLIDWQQDLGCWSADDQSESAEAREQEHGFSTFDPAPGQRLIYVSASTGNDTNTGLSPASAVRTLRHASSLVREGEGDFLLLRRGDVFREGGLGRFKSGKSASQPLIVASYGDSTLRPRLLLDQHFLDHRGQERNYVALLGLHFVTAAQVPDSPQFSGEARLGLRLVGGGRHWLIEDCHFEHAEFVIQSYAGHHYEQVEIRRNNVEHAYQVGTCGQNSKIRPSGLYTSHVEGLLIEENLFDHNGWSEVVPQACATMYNHNLYLNANELVVRGNLIARSSSMGIKMRSDSPGDARDLLFENNLFFDGEIGLSIGGNSHDPGRFQNVIVRQNVFSEIGRSNPTQREFSWGLDLEDTTNSLIEANYFLTQPWFDAAYAIAIHGHQSDLVVTKNVFAGLRGVGLKLKPQDSWNSPLHLKGNQFHQSEKLECLIATEAPLDALEFENNVNFTRKISEICASKSNAEEAPSRGAFAAFDESTNDHRHITVRTLADYAKHLGLEPSVEALLSAAAKQSRLNHEPELSAPAINDYIRAGFTGTP